MFVQPYCWYGCGRRANKTEPLGMSGSAYVEAYVCGRRNCRRLATVRHMVSDFLAAIGWHR